MIKRILVWLLLISTISFSMSKEYFGTIVGVVGKGKLSINVYAIVLKPDNTMKLVYIDDDINYIVNDSNDETKYKQLVGSKVYSIKNKRTTIYTIELNEVSK